MGFFENIGILLGLTEGNFSDDELASYLDTITRKKRIAARRAGVENSLEWLATIEAITRLEQEIEALQRQLRPAP